MPVVMLVAVAVVLVAVFFVATGRGGEMSRERPDHAPLDLGPVSAADVALLRPPTALWGYNVEVTDEALDVIARAMRDRDVTIAYLQQQLAEQNPGTPQVPQALHPAPAGPDPQYLPSWYGPRPPPATEGPGAEPGPADPSDPGDQGRDNLVPWDEPAGHENEGRAGE